MKRLGLLCLLLFFGLLVGCSKELKTEQWGAALEEAQRIEVEQVGENNSTIVATNKKAIKKFTDALEVDKWKMKQLPDGAEKTATYYLYEEGTIHTGESGKAVPELKKVASVTTYKHIPYIRFAIKKIAFDFKVPERTIHYLAELRER